MTYALGFDYKVTDVGPRIIVRSPISRRHAKPRRPANLAERKREGDGGTRRAKVNNVAPAAMSIRSIARYFQPRLRAFFRVPYEFRD